MTLTPFLIQVFFLDYLFITNESIKAVAQFCQNLQHLSLSELSKIDNLSILCIARFCLKLESLNLACSWTDYINNTTNIRKITDPVVVLLGKKCTSDSRFYFRDILDGR